MVRLRCSECDFSMQLRRPPGQAILCPQCGLALEDDNPPVPAAEPDVAPPPAFEPAPEPPEPPEPASESAFAPINEPSLAPMEEASTGFEPDEQHGIITEELRQAPPPVPIEPEVKKVAKVTVRAVVKASPRRKTNPALPPRPRDHATEEEANEDEAAPLRLAPVQEDAAEEEDDGVESNPRFKPKVLLAYAAAFSTCLAIAAISLPKILAIADDYLGDKKTAPELASKDKRMEVRPKQPPVPPRGKTPAKAEPVKPAVKVGDEQPDFEVPTLPALAMNQHTPEEVYKRLLGSTTWIIGGLKKGASSGTGTLIHVEKKLVLTNYHVIEGAKEIQVRFPEFKEGAVIADPTHYKDKGIQARVVAQDEVRDLVLLELKSLPKEARAVVLSEKSLTPGARVYSIGSSGASDRVLWRFSEGAVRQVTYAEINFKEGARKFAGRIVETQSPLNKGDSGGAVVNDQLELAAVVCMSHTEANLVNQCVDIREVRTFLNAYSSANNVTWPKPAAVSVEKDQPAVERAVLALLPILEKGNSASKIKALAVLLQAGKHGRHAIPTVLRLLKHRDDEVRRLSVMALERIGTPGDSALPLLREALRDEHPLVRRYAAHAVERMGPAARPALREIMPLLKDADHDIRRAALRAVAALGPDARSAAPLLLFRLMGKDVEECRLAAEALVAIGPLPPGEAGTAAAALEDERPIVHIAAAGMLLVSRADERAQGLLENVLRETADEKVQELALQFLLHVPTDRLAKMKLADLIRGALTHAQPSIRRASLELIEKTAPKPDAIAIDLIECFDNDEDTEVRLKALQVLARFKKEATKATPSLSNALDDEDPRIRAAVLKALARLGPDARAACPRLIAMMNDEKSHKAAIATLTALGAGAVRDLTFALRNRDPHIRLGAAIALGQIGPEARTAALSLSQAARTDPFPGIRQAAQLALTQVQAKR